MKNLGNIHPGEILIEEFGKIDWNGIKQEINDNFKTELEDHKLHIIREQYSSKNLMSKDNILLDIEETLIIPSNTHQRCNLNDIGSNPDSFEILFFVLKYLF